MDFIQIGYGNLLNAKRIVAIVSAEAAPTKRMIAAAREQNCAVDATCGKKTKTVFIMDSGHVVLSAKQIENFYNKTGKAEEFDE